MKPAHLPLLICLAASSSLLASGPEKNPIRKLFSSKKSPATEQINSQIYKPGRSKNFSPDFGPSPDWVPSGGTRMSYTASGKIAVLTDTSDFFGNTYLRKEIHSYDAADRETEVLNQVYDNQNMTWNNQYRSVITYDQQGMLQESRYDQWTNGSWVVFSGYQDVRTYNSQNLPTGRIRKTYSNTDSAWVNEGRTTDYQYDAQNRLISYVDQEWESTDYVNSEKIILEYGADNKPSQALLQEWNGTSFVDSARIIEIQWYLWQGNLESAMPLSFIEQKKSGANWVNYEKQVNSFTANGSQTSLTQRFVNAQWQNDSRSSSIFDDKLNPVFQGDEKYDPALAKWDTTEYSSLHLNSYDPSGRILETILRQMSNINGPDEQPELGWQNARKRLFFEHQVFTDALAEISGRISLFPNPLACGTSFRLNAGSGRLTLLDMQGRMILEKAISGNEAVSTQGMKSGLYQISFEDEQGKIFRSRLMVQ